MVKLKEVSTLNLVIVLQPSGMPPSLIYFSEKWNNRDHFYIKLPNILLSGYCQNHMARDVADKLHFSNFDHALKSMINRFLP